MSLLTYIFAKSSLTLPTNLRLFSFASDLIIFCYLNLYFRRFFFFIARPMEDDRRHSLRIIIQLFILATMPKPNKVFSPSEVERLYSYEEKIYTEGKDKGQLSGQSDGT